MLSRGGTQTPVCLTPELGAGPHTCFGCSQVSQCMPFNALTCTAARSGPGVRKATIFPNSRSSWLGNSCEVSRPGKIQQFPRSEAQEPRVGQLWGGEGREQRVVTSVDSGPTLWEGSPLVITFCPAFPEGEKGQERARASPELLVFSGRGRAWD